MRLTRRLHVRCMRVGNQLDLRRIIYANRDGKNVHTWHSGRGALLYGFLVRMACDVTISVDRKRGFWVRPFTVYEHLWF